MEQLLICTCLRRLVLLSAFIVLPGCIPIPVVQELPFTEKALAFMEPGVTKRDDVEKILGKPSTIRNNSTISFYGKKRLMALLVSPYGLGEMGTDHVLMIQYGHDGVLHSYEVLRLGTVPGIFSAFKEGCSANGLCIVSLPMGELAVFDRPLADGEAKLFKPSKNHCSVYLYYSDYSSLGSNQSVVCPFADKSRSFAIYEGGYFHWLEEPGPITVSANTLQQEFEEFGSCSDFAQRPPDTMLGSEYANRLKRNYPGWSEYLFECRAGQHYFIHVHEKLKIWSGNSLDIFTDNLEKGTRSVLKRRLMLP